MFSFRFYFCAYHVLPSFSQGHPRSLWSTPVTPALPLYQSTSTGHLRSRWTVASVPKATRSPTHRWHLGTISSPSNMEGRITLWAAHSKLKSQVCFTVTLPSDLRLSDDKCLSYETNDSLKNVWKSGKCYVMFPHAARCTSYVKNSFSGTTQIFLSLLNAYKLFLYLF